ncbi:hypothetical protein TNCV_4944051 [Trichonephila clavipes]|nr:hypothetical protein TNCV_4944051 [Trichonephila clavipes]
MAVNPISNSALISESSVDSSPGATENLPCRGARKIYRGSMYFRWCGVVVRRWDAFSGIVLVTGPRFKLTRSVANSSCVAL